MLEGLNEMKNVKVFSKYNYYHCSSSVAIGEWFVLYLISVLLHSALECFLFYHQHSELLQDPKKRDFLSVACLSPYPTNALKDERGFAIWFFIALEFQFCMLTHTA